MRAAGNLPTTRRKAKLITKDTSYIASFLDRSSNDRVEMMSSSATSAVKEHGNFIPGRLVSLCLDDWAYLNLTCLSLRLDRLLHVVLGESFGRTLWLYSPVMLYCTSYRFESC